MEPAQYEELNARLEDLFEKVRQNSRMAQNLAKTEWNRIKTEVSTHLLAGFQTGNVKTEEESSKMFKMAEELTHIEIILSSKQKWR